MTLKKTSSFKNNQNTGSLYLVPTPIGNLGDMTLRAIETLKKVDFIAAEDTRNTKKLLNHFEIKTKQISFHEHNTQERIPKLIDYLVDGLSIAQVSDAGMPSISDPGHELVEECIKKGIPVIALPGANAGLTALIASGLVPQPFYFYGFLNRKKKDRIQELETLKQQKCTIILYEAPHRLKKTIQHMLSILGNRKIVLCRELTKRYEEFLRGTLLEINEWAQNSEIRGEFVIILEGSQEESTESSDTITEIISIEEQVQSLIDNENLKPNAAIKIVAKNNNLKKQDVYNQYHHLI